MNLLKRHRNSAFFMALYFAWFLYLAYWACSGDLEHSRACGAANAGLFMFTFLILFLYVLIILITIIRAHGNDRLDYFKILGMIIAVPILLLVLLFLFKA